MPKILHKLKTISHFTLAFVTLLLVLVLPGLFATAQWANISNEYLLVWASDKGTDDGKQDPDFLAVIDATPNSRTYGKVVNTASLPCIPKANLMDQLGIKSGSSSCNFNEAHHMTVSTYEDPLTKHKFVWAGGLMSANIFKFDVTDPLNIPPATLVVNGTNVQKFAGADDMRILPNGNLIATYLGSKKLTTPGGLVEFSPNGGVVAEYNAAKPGGPTRYVPSINHVTDTGLLAHPHGIEIRPDLNVLISSDYADPTSLATSNHHHNPASNTLDNGTTIRVWNLSNLAAGVQKIIQVPNGPRVEKKQICEEPEGLMQARLLHQPGNKGAFAASMSGGVVYYTPDITAPNPQFVEVYDVGPCTGAADFWITENDNFLVLPISGMESPGDPLYNRDYPGEHSRRLIVLDIRPLLRKGSGKIQCNAPSVINDRTTGFTTKLLGHNNKAQDCPTEVPNFFNVDSALNFSQHGGPHWVQLNGSETRLAFSDYFADLQSFGLPGTGMVGDLKVYSANFDKRIGKAALDRRFKDELTGEVGINFARPVTYKWAGARGKAGAAKPHGMVFVKAKNLNRNTPSSYPPGAGYTQADCPAGTTFKPLPEGYVCDR